MFALTLKVAVEVVFCFCFFFFFFCYRKTVVDKEKVVNSWRGIVRCLSAKYRPDRYRRDKSVKFGTELPQHLPINTGGGARYKWS